MGRAAITALAELQVGRRIVNPAESVSRTEIVKKKRSGEGAKLVILTVTLNAAIDKTFSIDHFSIDRVHRPTSWEIVPGGKGINVARVYRTLGGEAVATGFIGGHNGEAIQDGLRSEGIPFDFTHTAGESRVCIAVVDHAENTQTEINENGPLVTDEEIERMKLKFESLVQGMEFAVLSGSAPPGTPANTYADLIEIARKYGVRCMLDTSGEHLAGGIAATPYIIKPNSFELSAVLGRQISTVEEAAQAASEYNAKGIEVVIVTLGRDGAIVASQGVVWWAKSPEIRFVSAVGSGDSLAAAFLFSFLNGSDLVDCLKMGTAAGAANAMTFGAGFCKREDILSLMDKVEVQELAEVMPRDMTT